MREEAKEIEAMGFEVGLVNMAGDPPAKFPTGVSGWSVKSKRPALSRWPKYDIEGVCLFTGELEIIDVDAKHWKEEGDFSAIFIEWAKNLPFFEKLVWYKTISGGLQFPYRCEASEGNQKLATRLTGKEAVIETRGKGGLAVCPPTVGYEWQDGGEWEAIPTLSIEERNEFIEACRDWNQVPEVKEQEITEARSYKVNLGKPGDDWAEKVDFIGWIKDHGWQIEKVEGEAILLRRPGKKTGCSASWNFGGSRRLFVWSTSTELPSEVMLKPFAVKAFLEFSGDFKACAMALHEQGFGNEALALVEACENCENWGEVGLVLQEQSQKVANSNWNQLSLGIQALDIKGVTENKLEKLRKDLVSVEKISWEDELTRDEDDKVKGRLYNLDLILNNAERFSGKFFFDDFNQRIVIRHADRIIEFDDTYMAMLRVTLAKEYGDFKAQDVEAVVTTIAKKNHFHPLQEKIQSLEWDGVSRVDTWLIKYCGAKDTKYNRIAGAKWLVSAIARLFHPGCKVDNALVLEGGQGTRKSTLLRVLSYDNFLDGNIDIRSKDGLMALFGKWIVEFSELEGLNGRKVETIKSFLGKQEDKIRLPYQKKEEYFKRTCVFAGTTNENHYLDDSSGNRRFWPIEIDRVKIDLITKDRDQLWAEVYQMFNGGYEWWVNEESDEAKYFRKEQKSRVIESDIMDLIEPYLQDNVYDDGKVRVKLSHVWEHALFGKPSQLDRRKEHEIADALKKYGLKKTKSSYKGVMFRGWVGPLRGDG